MTRLLLRPPLQLLLLFSAARSYCCGWNSMVPMIAPVAAAMCAGCSDTSISSSGHCSTFESRGARSATALPVLRLPQCAHGLVPSKPTLAPLDDSDEGCECCNERDCGVAAAGGDEDARAAAAAAAAAPPPPPTGTDADGAVAPRR